MKASPSFQQSMFEDPLERHYWMTIWEKLFLTGTPDSWAYRWSLVCMANSGLTALPNQNLVTNIGFGDDATHTTGQATAVATSGLPTIKHPKVICRDAGADAFAFNSHFGGAKLRSKRLQLRNRLASWKQYLLDRLV